MLGFFGLLSLGSGIGILGMTFGGCLLLLAIIWLICFLFSHPKLFGVIIITGIGWGIYEIIHSINEDNFREEHTIEKMLINNSFKISDLGSSFLNKEIDDIQLYNWEHQEIVNKDTIYSGYSYSNSHILSKYADNNDHNSFVYGIHHIRALNKTPYMIEYHLNKCTTEYIINFLKKHGYQQTKPIINNGDSIIVSYYPLKKEVYYPYELCYRKDNIHIEIDTTSNNRDYNICIYDYKRYHYIEYDIEQYKNELKTKKENKTKNNIVEYMAKT